MSESKGKPGRKKVLDNHAQITANLDQKQVEDLDELASRLRRSRISLIREAVDDLIQKYSKI